MKLCFTDESWEDYLYWQQKSKPILKKVNDLIKDISRHPFEVIGKTEPLKHQLKGCWSRRIDQEHRIVYGCSENEVIIISCRFHY